MYHRILSLNASQTFVCIISQDPITASFHCMLPKRSSVSSHKILSPYSLTTYFHLRTQPLRIPITLLDPQNTHPKREDTDPSLILRSPIVSTISLPASLVRSPFFAGLQGLTVTVGGCVFCVRRYFVLGSRATRRNGTKR